MFWARMRVRVGYLTDETLARIRTPKSKRSKGMCGGNSLAILVGLDAM